MLTRIVLLVLVLSACDQDPFALSQRRLAGDYLLQKFEDESYFLVDKAHPIDSGGVLGGPVLRVGWNAHYILAQRVAFKGKDTAWVAVNVDAHIVEGPTPETQLRTRKGLLGAAVISAESAWVKLK